MRTLILILVTSCTAFGQLELHEWSLLDSFDQGAYEEWGMYTHLGVQRCPWSSWSGGFHPTNRIQIDIAVNYEALQTLWHDRWMLSQDLYKLFWEMPKESLELVKRGYRIEIYKALFFPAYTQYDIVPSEDWIDFSGHIANPLWGWYRRHFRGTAWPMSRIPIAIKQAGIYEGEQYWIVSTCIVLDRKYNGELRDSTIEYNQLQELLREPEKTKQ